MGILAFTPIRLPGPWDIGIALDRHILRSDFLGYDEYDHPQFNTVRTQLGEALFLVKYRNDRSHVADIVETISAFIRENIALRFKIDVICPVPPSRMSRPFQPVPVIAEALAETLSIPFDGKSISRQPSANLAKNMSSYEERQDMVEKSLKIQPGAFSNKTILLLDDLYQTGATAETIAKACRIEGRAAQIVFLAITKTRV